MEHNPQLLVLRAGHGAVTRCSPWQPLDTGVAIPSGPDALKFMSFTLISNARNDRGRAICLYSHCVFHYSKLPLPS